MATVHYLGDGGPDGTELRGTMTISGALSTTGTTNLGAASTDLIGFHGVPAVDQAALVTLEVTVSASVVASRVKSIIALLIEKGLMASA
jgi:hypothetical protein